MVAQARERLAALSGPATGKADFAARRIWTGEEAGGVPVLVAPTADGRSLLFVHWDSGDAAVRDMATGEIKRLGFKKSWAESGEFVQFALFSPDQRQIAYTWYDGTRFDFRTISTQPGAKPHKLIALPEFNRLFP